mmetsp:Transcript_27793/g.57141  ORF Transcript_27793/g.57141 Transcript_27793/m.57141 type:complete len:95 (+) Transcript_27793:1092-1376(+)
MYTAVVSSLSGERSNYFQRLVIQRPITNIRLVPSLSTLNESLVNADNMIIHSSQQNFCFRFRGYISLRPAKKYLPRNSSATHYNIHNFYNSCRW